jgi:hypothetical protein
VENSTWGGSPVAEITPEAPNSFLLEEPSKTPIQDDQIRLAEAPSLPAEAPLGIALDEPTEPIVKSDLPPGTRKGAFQKLSVGTSYLPRFEGDSIGVSTIEADVMFGVPFPRFETPLLITPGYRVLFLDGPTGFDLPPRVHEAVLDLHHFRRIDERWLFDGAVTIGEYADDHSFGESEALRVTGRALGIYQANENWKYIVGVVYLNRAGLSVVPAVGATYSTDDFKLDLVFPRPRIAWRQAGSTVEDNRWVYFQGELGGGLWAIQTPAGQTEELSYNDWRIMLGYERKRIGALSHSIELGYVFNRDVELEKAGAEFSLDDSLFLRAGVSY